MFTKTVLVKQFKSSGHLLPGQKKSNMYFMLQSAPKCACLSLRKIRPENSSPMYTAAQQTSWEQDFTFGIVMFVINSCGDLHVNQPQPQTLLTPTKHDYYSTRMDVRPLLLDPLNSQILSFSVQFGRTINKMQDNKDSK